MLICISGKAKCVHLGSGKKAKNLRSILKQRCEKISSLLRGPITGKRAKKMSVFTGFQNSDDFYEYVLVSVFRVNAGIHTAN